MSWPYYSDEEIEAVQRVLRSGRVNYWTGKEGKCFEKEFANSVCCKYGVALANGTVALELALHAVGVSESDEVIVPSRTFIATASSVVMRGAIPVVADVDPCSGNITVETIDQVRTERTTAVIVVHLAGWPCEMNPILNYARKHNLIVVEDCAQAHGATYRGKPVGSFGRVAAFSFCQDKIMSTGGEGGMLTTSDEKVWKRAWSYKDHGKSVEALQIKGTQGGQYRWLHDTFGSNFRMTEIQATIGRCQLKKLTEWVTRRRYLVSLLSKCISDIPCLRIETPPSHIKSSYYQYYVYLRPAFLRSGWNRQRIINAINEEGASCKQGICCEIFRENAFKKFRVDLNPSLPVAAELAEHSIMFSIHPMLSDDDILQTCQVVNTVMSAAMNTIVGA